jgi:uncharacterized protein
MLIKALAFVLTVLTLAAPAAAAPRAEPAFVCGDPRQGQSDTICADRELVGLGKAVNRRFGILLGEADPLTALLLARDQTWFADLLGGTQTPPFSGQDDPERLRLKDVLTRRLAMLSAVKPRAMAATPAGIWANALATVTVREADGGALAVSFEASLRYEGRGTLACALAGTLRPDGMGWFAGELSPPAADVKERVRLRLQGNTLRLVNVDADVVDGRPPPIVCGPLAIVTGSYFPTNPAQPGTAAMVAARTVSPSFKCATARNSDEEEICADPELAARDGEIARAFAQVMHRLAPALAANLRADQRGWASDNPKAYDDGLHPPANKENYDLHDTDGARAELLRRLDERLAMLLNLDEKREGVLGLWEAYNAVVVIGPAPDKTGTIVGDGFKWSVGEHKEFCIFKSTGRMQDGVFKPDEAFPTLTRDGAMLVTSIEAPDHDRAPPGGPAPYCNNMRSAKARLFPVKPAAGPAERFDRLR